MKPWKRRLLFIFLTACAAAVVVLLMGIAYLLTPDEMPDLDPEKIFGDGTLGAPEAPIRPVGEKEHLDLLTQIPESDARARAMLETLLRIEERDGRDNALIHYAAVSWLSPEHPTPPQGELIARTLEEGWRSPECDELLSYLESWRPVMDAIRRGAALDYARGSGVEPGGLGTRTHQQHPTRFPHRVARVLTALAVEARCFEFRGEYAKALDDYLTALTVGRDHTVLGNEMAVCRFGFGHTAGISKTIRRLADTGCLDENDARRALDRLGQIENSLGDLTDALAVEAADALDSLRRTRNAREYLTTAGGWPSPGLREAIRSARMRNREERDTALGYCAIVLVGVRARLEASRLESDFTAIYEMERKLIDEPWTSDLFAMQLDLVRKIRSSSILLQFSPLDTDGFSAQDLDILGLRKGRANAVSSLREARLALALNVWERRHEEYPETLDSLAPEFFADGLPLDPFSEAVYHYRRSPDGESYDLWSVGPDKKDDDLTVGYDPSNGTLSGGDLSAAR